MNRTKSILGLALGVALGGAGSAEAQQTTLPNARPVWESASGGSVANRAPGRMVRQGTARYRTAHAAMLNHARNGPTITATEPAIDTETQLKVDVLNTIFTDLNVALLLLAQQISGDDPATPDDPDEPATDVSALLGTPHSR
ncbi:MAG: hypothetical protein GY842_21895 [bacterium]|nr:hypothetical protein [bacterium]